jgi:hypothetical protein
MEGGGGYYKYRWRRVRSRSIQKLKRGFWFSCTQEEEEEEEEEAGYVHPALKVKSIL